MIARLLQAEEQGRGQGGRFCLRFLGSTIVFFVSALILFIVTNALAYFHGKQFLQELGVDAKTALGELQPQRLLVRFYRLQDWQRCHTEPFVMPVAPFMCTSDELRACKESRPVRTIFGAVSCPAHCRANSCQIEDWVPCHKAYTEDLLPQPQSYCSPDAWQRCFGRATSCTFQETYRAHQYFPFRLPGAVYDLGWEIWENSSPSKAVIDLAQLVAGCFVAFVFCGYVMDRTGVRAGSVQFYVFYFLVPVIGVIATCILALPLLLVMYLGSEVLSDIVPEHCELSLYGASMTTIFFACSGRSAEAGLHHGLDRLIEHAIERLRGP